VIDCRRHGPRGCCYSGHAILHAADATVAGKSTVGVGWTLTLAKLEHKERRHVARNCDNSNHGHNVAVFK
jgi:hypothetical protein